MIRFALSPEAIITPDYSARLPGRGAWLSSNRQALEKALRKGAFARAFKSAANPPDGQSPEAFAAWIEAGLVERALARLGMARRRGRVVIGFEKVRASIGKGRACCLICARETSEESVRKITRGAKQGEPIRLFAAQELADALGLEDVRHVAITDQTAATGFLTEARRLAGFRQEKLTASAR